MLVKLSDEVEEYHVKIKWTGGKSGRVIVKDKPEIITGTPPEFGAEKEYYSPEELFVASGSVCFMNSFVYFTKKMRIAFKSLEIEAVGFLEKVGKSYEITKINQKATVIVESENLRKKFERAIELGAKYCFVANSMKCPTIHENVILVE